MAPAPTIARIWRGRIRREQADACEAYLRAEGPPPLERTALGVQVLREDRDGESHFVTISYRNDLEAMAAFTGGAPDKVRDLPRDAAFLVEPPQRVEIFRILADKRPVRLNAAKTASPDRRA